MSIGEPSDFLDIGRPLTPIEEVYILLESIRGDLERDVMVIGSNTDHYFEDKGENRYWDGRFAQMKKFILQMKEAQEQLLASMLEPDDWVCQNCYGGQVLGYENSVEDCDECNATGVYKLHQLRMDENDPWTQEGEPLRLCGRDGP